MFFILVNIAYRKNPDGNMRTKKRLAVKFAEKINFHRPVVSSEKVIEQIK